MNAPAVQERIGHNFTYHMPFGVRPERYHVLGESH
jgi:hypothetical protein